MEAGFILPRGSHPSLQVVVLTGYFTTTMELSRCSGSIAATGLVIVDTGQMKTWWLCGRLMLSTLQLLSQVQSEMCLFEASRSRPRPFRPLQRWTGRGASKLCSAVNNNLKFLLKLASIHHDAGSPSESYVCSGAEVAKAVPPKRLSLFGLW